MPDVTDLMPADFAAMPIFGAETFAAAPMVVFALPFFPIEDIFPNPAIAFSPCPIAAGRAVKPSILSGSSAMSISKIYNSIQLDSQI